MKYKLKPFFRPLCDHPQLLVNRNAVNLLMSDSAYLDCQQTYLHKDCCFVISDFDYSKWLGIGYRVCSKWFRKTGQFDDASLNALSGFVVRHPHHDEYLFQLVSCGHCDCCVNQKMSDFHARVIYEGQTSPNRPLFVTLTYTNEYIPRKVADDGTVLERGLATCDRHKSVLSKKDVQNFLKRLRVRWNRSPSELSKHDALKVNQYGYDFRYVAVGEYGDTSNHAHYHFIFWGYPYYITSDTDLLRIDAVRNDILSAWGMQDLPRDPTLKSVQVARDCADYVSEYVFGASKSKRKGFMTASNRGGGIGSRFLDTLKPRFHAQPRLQVITFQDKWTGKLVDEQFGKYATNRIFPSVNSLLRKGNYKTIFMETLQRAREEVRSHRECQMLLQTGLDLVKKQPSWKAAKILIWSTLLTQYMPHTSAPVLDVDLDFHISSRNKLRQFLAQTFDKSRPFRVVTARQLLEQLASAWEKVKDIDFDRAYTLRYEHLLASDYTKYTLDFICQKAHDIRKKRSVALARKVF